MYAVGRLGSYITRVFYTASGPFHPFGGAVDIIVVKQQDGTFKSSPWYVRFGKFQGVLKSREKIVNISVDGVQSDLHMYLDARGQAYFLREVECEEGDSLFVPSSSNEDTDGLVSGGRALKSKSCNYNPPLSDSITRINLGNEKILARTGSHRSHNSGLVFGRSSMKENSSQEEEDGSEVVRADSLERAEMAADLLEVKWSTYLAFGGNRRKNGLRFSNSCILVNEAGEDSLADTRSRPCLPKLGSSNEDFGAEMTYLNNDLQGKGYVQNSHMAEIDGLVLMNADNDENIKLFASETTSPVSDSVELDAHLSMRASDEFGLKKEIGDPENVCGAELKPGENTVQETSLVVAEGTLDFVEPLVDNELNDLVSDGHILGETSRNTFANSRFTETYTEIPVDASVNVSESGNICPISNFENSLTQETVNIVSAVGLSVSSSEGMEEEQLLFGELDDLNLCEGVCIESSLPTQFVGDNNPSVRTRNNEEEDGEKTRVVSSSISILKRDKFEGEDLVRMAKSLPNMWPPIKDVVLDELLHPLGHSLDSNFKASNGTATREDLSSCINTDADKDEVEQSNVEDAQMMQERNGKPASPKAGNASKVNGPSNVSWRVWPFPFKRSKSMNNTEQLLEATKSLVSESNLECSIGTNGEEDNLKPKMRRKKQLRVLTPTSEQLASLNLKEGKNTVTFTFSTSMLGQQKVDARIYLWKWDTRIVISDVDGTITKSDVLGQFMPIIGMDWSQTGVAHLYSAIKENGYQLLFLSARAISQAYHTRQFLFNLEQDGKALPDGPVVISPDGLVPSLFREVVRRAPHEFKIACLEDIKALFPSDRNPFYAGFGNRDTDEISYLKVGIPRGKIFTINPKGEIVVNRRVDRKSYTSLKALVHDMFPPMTSSEQEDFNSWNYWKLPPPVIDV